MLTSISAAEAGNLIAKGALLIDIREADEHARERISGARSSALSKMPGSLGKTDAGAVIFHCKSGGRTAANATLLRGAVSCDAYVLEGGIEGWKASGMPVLKDASQPLEIMRQVQISAGTLVLAGVALANVLHPAWIGLSAFIGSGLVFAGASGWCGMAKLLAAMPWNWRAA